MMVSQTAVKKRVQAAAGVAAGEGSRVSVFLTAGRGFVTSGTTAEASGRASTARNASAATEFHRRHHHRGFCSRLSLRVIVGAIAGSIRNRSCFILLFRVVWLLRKWFGEEVAAAAVAGRGRMCLWRVFEFSIFNNRGLFFFRLWTTKFGKAYFFSVRRYFCVILVFMFSLSLTLQVL
ncbi:uncharacterized protein LOC107616680 [Arachis ipaensis]|uniref:Uncharacterized protein n=1 Tax=Arachis hypogaea TaxID=3818 RepID=A0A6B9VBC7_ARAHY|nr:uncharacterized protein LOC107616680 [Arachis ipaensis]XP_025677577.1 uncharacterized protein LOC112777425 [Arachis hypogaea]QHN77518.1 uncharacterized protein DS421_19g653410 [Arachis hypogaea]